MDPLSAIASIFAIYQLASKIGEICFQYAEGVRNANKETDYVVDEIAKFQRSLLTLKRMLADEEEVKRGGDRLKHLKDLIEGDSVSLKLCKTDLENLQAKLENGKLKEGLKAMIHKLSWPLKEEEVRKITERLRNVAVLIDRALTMDTTEMIRDVDTTTKRIASSLESAEVRQKKEEEERRKKEEQKTAEKTRQSIIQWLEHPDQVENHNVASDARNDMAKTGRWFLDGDTFKEFRGTPQSLLFLHGDSGCGKTILCSAIIDELQALQRGDTQIEIAFWYYYANDKKRTTLNNLVRALITQFVPSSSIPTPLIEFWKLKKNGQETPKVSDLIQTLRKILAEKTNRTCYIVLDALDESDEHEREELMEMLKNILSLDSSGIRILVTSRTNTAGIETELKELTKFYNITIEREYVNLDILAHITERLQNDKILKAWPEKERERVKEGLVEKAAGMFRWVDCQLQAIRKCKTPADLNRTLNTLPKDVHEQYARELAGITDDSQRALKILQWLAFPQRKLRIEEVADMIAVDFEQDPPVFDDQNKMWNSEGVLEICGSLVRADVNPDGRNSLGEPAEVQTLTTAHATVSDFLQTQTIRIGLDPEVRFTRSTVNLRMAETCLVYLRYFVDNNIELTEENVVRYPFARFCAEFWDDHYREVIANPQEKINMTRLNAMIMDLFQSPDAMLKWVRLCNPDDDTSRVDFSKQTSDVLTPIYYAALLGLPEIVRRFINQDAAIDDTFNTGYGTPLVAASVLGRKEVVSLLLERGADPNLSGWWYWGCPLAGAVEQNQTEIVKMLLDRKDIDINCRRVPLIKKDWAPTTVEEHLDKAEIPENKQADDVDNKTDKVEENATKVEGRTEDGEKSNEENSDELYEKQVSCESMVYIAASYNSPEVAKVLLEAGADPNIEGGLYHTALQAACVWGYEDILGSLLEKGAKVDNYGGAFESPLIAACYYGFTEIVKKLVAKGSNINHAGGEYVCALYAACSQEKVDVVELLLKQNARVEIYGGTYDNPLQAACATGNTAIAEKLLEAGSDPNRKGGEYGSALYAACTQQKKDLVGLLLDKGANPNTQDCGRCDNALQQACEYGNEGIVRLLIEKKADPNLHGGFYGDAFQAGCSSGNQTIVRLLLDAGADIKFRGGSFGTPLQAAVYSGSEAVTRFLLDSGESVNEKGGQLSYPVVRASACEASWDAVLRLLLEHGADPNLEREGDDEVARQYRTPLQNTANESMAIMLLDNGALINTQSGYFGTALHCALGAPGKDAGMARQLISRGADVNAPHWYHGTPLAVACSMGKIDDLKLLLKNGANMDVYDMIGRNPICIAALNREWDVFDHLFKLGGDPLHQDKRGCGGLQYAARAGGNDVLKQILGREPDVNQIDSNGWSPLHWAAASGYGTAKVLKTLLQAGSTRNLKDKQGRTALDLATAFKKDEEAAILAEEAFLDLPETNDGERLGSFSFCCDGCGEVRNNSGLECLYHCSSSSCLYFDLCFRCILDKDVIHFPDHEFMTGFSYPT